MLTNSEVDNKTTVETSNLESEKASPKSAASASTDLDSQTYADANAEAHSSSNKEETLTVPILSGNPLVSVCYGKVHLYRPSKSHGVSLNNTVSESSENRQTNNVSASSDGSSSEQWSLAWKRPQEDNEHNKHDKDNSWVCVLAVPSYMELADFYAFLGSFRDRISHIRIVRDARAHGASATSTSSRYMVLLNFRDSICAEEFYEEYNGKPFCSFDTSADSWDHLDRGESSGENCRLFFISGVDFNSNANGNNVNNVKGEEEISGTENDPECSKENDGTREEIDKHKKLDGFTEVPTCPVCLERLDPSASGMMTTVCNHTFHCQCLAKWQKEDLACPVCRYVRTANGEGEGGDIDSLTVCGICNSRESLWICMICGNVGCGRYNAAHARDHFQLSGHAYALELETQRVWDYAGDGYVHRLIQNKVDGKLVELPDPHRTASYERSQVPPETDASAVAAYREKTEQLYIEYNELLCSQLDTQRNYFESHIEELRRQADNKNKMLQKKCREWQSKAEKYEKEFQFTKQLNDSLIANQRELRSKVDALSKERTNMLDTLKMAKDSSARVKELEEQVRDLMFFLDTQNKVESSPLRDEIQEGSIGVVENQTSCTEDESNKGSISAVSSEDMQTGSSKKKKSKKRASKKK